MNRFHLQMLFSISVVSLCAQPVSAQTLEPLVRTVDLDIGEQQQVTLADGSMHSVRLVALREATDSVRGAVRRAEVDIEVDGAPATLVSATYHLPIEVGETQVDCPITRGYNSNGRGDSWGLDKDARLRLWPKQSVWIRPETFAYPVNQRWFATHTQMANEPTYADAGENPQHRTNIYYHSGLDIGGAEGLVAVTAATDGLIVSAGNDVLEGHSEDTPVAPRADVVYVLDARGWYYRYSHLKAIDERIHPGRVVSIGDSIGILGKEGASGGWSHLHFEIKSRQPSGKWGTQAGYAFLWQAYRDQYEPQLIAVARPHHLARTGESVELDGSRSWSADDSITAYRWTLHDGSTASGQRLQRKYSQPGYYSEMLQVSDAAGNTAYDFATAVIVDDQRPELVPSIHATYFPTMGIKPGQTITFKVRTFETTHGEETWDFGDASPTITTKSDGNVVKLAPDGYATTTHSYAEAGDFIVNVTRSDEQGRSATAQLWVHVEP